MPLFAYYTNNIYDSGLEGRYVYVTDGQQRILDPAAPDKDPKDSLVLGVVDTELRVVSLYQGLIPAGKFVMEGTLNPQGIVTPLSPLCFCRNPAKVYARIQRGLSVDHSGYELFLAAYRKGIEDKVSANMKEVDKMAPFPPSTEDMESIREAMLQDIQPLNPLEESIARLIDRNGVIDKDRSSLFR